jgi:phosphate transport system protein
MLKELLSKQKSSLVYEAIEEILKMLEGAGRMFAIGCDFASSDEQSAQVLAQSDREINMGERLVRRLIFQHLTVNPKYDLPASLAILSIIHDVERLGDYAKNLFELNQWGDLCNKESRHRQRYAEIRSEIEPLFSNTMDALGNDDAEAARQIMRKHENIKSLTDEFVSDLVQDLEGGPDAVLYALASRFLRRTSGHLSNVASSLTNPLDRVGGNVV